MRFSAILATVAAFVAAPITASPIATDVEPTIYHITGFHVWAYPNKPDLFYNLNIHAHSPNPKRVIKYAFCELELRVPEIVPVTIANCFGHNIYFQWQKYNDDGETGWRLTLSHPYHQFNTDYAIKKFPSSLFKTVGSGRKKHVKYDGPHTFNITAKSFNG